jgi:hypothetical protein
MALLKIGVEFTLQNEQFRGIAAAKDYIFGIVRANTIAQRKINEKSSLREGSVSEPTFFDALFVETKMDDVTTSTEKKI